MSHAYQHSSEMYWAKAQSVLVCFAIANTQVNDFALILLDIMMPEMDGFDIARQLREGDRSDDPAPGERGCAPVVTFSERIGWIRECTNSEDATGMCLRIGPSWRGQERPCLTLSPESIQRLRQHSNSRRVLLLICESRERGSETALDQAVVAAQTAGVRRHLFRF